MDNFKPSQPQTPTPREWRIRCIHTELRNVAYVWRNENGVSCALENGIPASLSYAGVLRDEMGVRFALGDAENVSVALRILATQGGRLWRYVDVSAGATGHLLAGAAKQCQGGGAIVKTYRVIITRTVTADSADEAAAMAQTQFLCDTEHIEVEDVDEDEDEDEEGKS